MLLVLCVLCFASYAFMRKENVGALFLLIQIMSLQAHLCWFLLFVKSHGSMAPIGALDYRKMKSCEYLKDESFAI